MSIRARAGWVMLLDQGIADNVGGDLSGAATPTIVLRTDTRSVALELGGWLGQARVSAVRIGRRRRLCNGSVHRSQLVFRPHCTRNGSAIRAPS